MLRRKNNIRLPTPKKFLWSKPRQALGVPTFAVIFLTCQSGHLAMTKTTILFIQGGGKGAYEVDKKLVDRLGETLGDRYKIIFPKMPDESDPDYEKYKIKIEKELDKINSDFILAGHSLGACFLLKYISERKIDKDISGIFLLST